MKPQILPSKLQDFLPKSKNPAHPFVGVAKSRWKQASFKSSWDNSVNDKHLKFPFVRILGCCFEQEPDWPEVWGGDVA